MTGDIFPKQTPNIHTPKRTKSVEFGFAGMGDGNESHVHQMSKSPGSSPSSYCLVPHDRVYLYSSHTWCIRLPIVPGLPAIKPKMYRVPTHLLPQNSLTSPWLSRLFQNFLTFLDFPGFPEMWEPNVSVRSLFQQIHKFISCNCFWHITHQLIVANYSHFTFVSFARSQVPPPYSLDLKYTMKLYLKKKFNEFLDSPAQLQINDSTSRSKTLNILKQAFMKSSSNWYLKDTRRCKNQFKC